MANIKDMLGDKYTEGMTAEEMISELEKIDLPKDNTDEITRLRNALTKSNAEAAENKRKLKDHMSEEEKRVAEEAERLQAIENENKELKKKITVSEFTSKFLASGLDQKSASECAIAATEGNIDTIIAHFNTRIASAKEDAKAELIGSTPKLEGGSNGAVKDYTVDIDSSIAIGDYANAAALMRVAQENNKNN